MAGHASTICVLMPCGGGDDDDDDDDDKVERKKTLFIFLTYLHVLVETESVFVFYTRVWDTRNMQPAFTFPAQQYFQVCNFLED